uniref:Uncharacterized protein n=1 Tax=Dulem virus 42 TaxID=3145760 RepID=A0AAU8BAC7_9CAUD
MKALVVTYDGKVPSGSEMEQFLSTNSSFIDELHDINVFSEENISKILMKHCVPTKVNTEDGDAAVTYLAGVVKSFDKDVLTTAIVKHFLNVNDSSDASIAFTSAICTLADNKPVSKAVSDRYHFTKAARNVITELYKIWKNRDV